MEATLLKTLPKMDIAVLCNHISSMGLEASHIWMRRELIDSLVQQILSFFLHQRKEHVKLRDSVTSIWIKHHLPPSQR